MISGHRVLCSAASALGHAVPTAALALEFQRQGNDVLAITYSGKLAEFYGRVGIPCVDLQPTSGKQEVAMLLSLCSDFDPDITVCDWAGALQIVQFLAAPRCRLSILRCENFLGNVRLSPYLPNKFAVGPIPRQSTFGKLLRLFNQPPISDYRLIHGTEIVVVPSLPEFDPPPPDAERNYPNSMFVYTGPLLLDCFDPAPAALQSWVIQERQRGKRIVLVTTGTAWGREFCVNLAKSMDRARFSCIMTISDKKTLQVLKECAHPNLIVVGPSRLQDLISQADAVIHHCGHGTFQSVLLAGKPSITVPSFEFDREDNALRLEDLGCSIHLNDGVLRRGLNIEQLNDAVDNVLSDGKIAAATACMSRKVSAFTAERGPGYVLKILEENKLLPSSNRHRRSRINIKRSYSRLRFPFLRILFHALRARLRSSMRKLSGS